MKEDEKIELVNLINKMRDEVMIKGMSLSREERVTYLNAYNSSREIILKEYNTMNYSNVKDNLEVEHMKFLDKVSSLKTEGSKVTDLDPHPVRKEKGDLSYDQILNHIGVLKHQIQLYVNMAQSKLDEESVRLKKMVINGSIGLDNSGSDFFSGKEITQKRKYRKREDGEDFKNKLLEIFKKFPNKPLSIQDVCKELLSDPESREETRRISISLFLLKKDGRLNSSQRGHYVLVSSDNSKG